MKTQTSKNADLKNTDFESTGLEMLSVVMAWLRDEDLRSLSKWTSTAG